MRVYFSLTTPTKPKENYLDFPTTNPIITQMYQETDNIRQIKESASTSSLNILIEEETDKAIETTVLIYPERVIELLDGVYSLSVPDLDPAERLKEITTTPIRLYSDSRKISTFGSWDLKQKILSVNLLALTTLQNNIKVLIHNYLYFREEESLQSLHELVRTSRFPQYSDLLNQTKTQLTYDKYSRLSDQLANQAVSRQATATLAHEWQHKIDQDYSPNSYFLERLVTAAPATIPATLGILNLIVKHEPTETLQSLAPLITTLMTISMFPKWDRLCYQHSPAEKRARTIEEQVESLPHLHNAIKFGYNI